MPYLVRRTFLCIQGVQKKHVYKFLDKIFFTQAKVISEVTFGAEFDGDLGFDLVDHLQGYSKVNIFFLNTNPYFRLPILKEREILRLDMYPCYESRSSIWVQISKINLGNPNLCTV